MLCLWCSAEKGRVRHVSITAQEKGEGGLGRGRGGGGGSQLLAIP